MPFEVLTSGHARMDVHGVGARFTGPPGTVLEPVTSCEISTPDDGPPPGEAGGGRAGTEGRPGDGPGPGPFLPSLVDRIGVSNTLSLFVAAGVFSLTFVKLYVPEPQGRPSLETPALEAELRARFS